MIMRVLLQRLQKKESVEAVGVQSKPYGVRNIQHLNDLVIIVNNEAITLRLNSSSIKL